MSSASSIRRACSMRAGHLAAISLLLLLLPLHSTMAAGNLIFEAPFLSWDVGCAPGAAAAGDLNGDGKPDLVAASSGRISVLLGNGDWTFASPVTYPTGDSPSCVVIADLNGDTVPDLVVAHTNGTRVSVLLGIGNGTFGPTSNYVTGGLSNRVAVADVSGDGRPDIAVTNWSSNAVSVLIGNGDGTFGAGTAYPAASYPTNLAIGDLNRDGLADLAVTARLSNKVLVFLGAGGGVFSPSTSFPASSPSDVRIADLDGDGNADLVVANGSQVSVFLGDGSGAYGTPSEYDCPSCGSLLLADFDGDGGLDIASASRGLTVLLGGGDGTFGASTFYDAGGYDDPYGIADTPTAADLNGDGKTDVVVANPRTQETPSHCPAGTVSMLVGNGDGTFGSRGSVFDAGDGVLFVTSRDLNGDGSLDLVTANARAGTVSVFLGDGHAGLGARNDFQVGSDPRCAAIGDLNRDGVPDLVAANRGANSLSVLLGTGDGSFGPKSDYPTGSRPASVAIGDLNRDGAPDLVAANGGSNTMSVLLGHGNGSFAPKSDIFLGLLGPEHPFWVAAGDLNGDGIPDLVVTLFGEYDFASGNHVVVLRGIGDGTFGAFGTTGSYPVGPNPCYVTLEDLNLDGRPDLAVANAGNVTDYYWSGGDGRVRALMGNGDGTFTMGGSWAVGDYPTSIAAADLDGDGKPDLAVASSFSHRVSVLLGDGNGTFGSRTDYGTSGPVASVVSGDLDGDGDLDLAMALANPLSHLPLDRLMVLRNLSPAGPTPTLLSLFHGDWTSRGIELRWRFGVPRSFTSLEVQRGVSAAGPWLVAGGERRDEGEPTVFLDSDAEAGRTYYYRLVAATAEGGTTTFGPLEVAAAGGAGRFALLPVSPDPARNVVRIGYAVAQRASVELSVMDVSGRRVAILAKGVHEPGPYEVAWEGTTDRGWVTSGLYFARLQAAGRQWTQRFVLVR